jgi:hypothetical protein
MSRPSTREELLVATDARFSRLLALIEAMSDEERAAAFAFDDRDRAVRDVLVHLHEWHVLLLEWVRANLAGTTRSFLPAPYTWASYQGMNVEIWERHQGTTLEEALALTQGSHDDAVALIHDMSDEDLFTKRRFPWTGTTSVGAYCVSATSSHYDWAITKLTKHRRSYGH